MKPDIHLKDGEILTSSQTQSKERRICEWKKERTNENAIHSLTVKVSFIDQ